MTSRAAADRYHASTKHGTPPLTPERLVPYRRLDPSNAPRPFKEYPGLETKALPPRLVESGRPASEVLSGRNGRATKLDADLLATLLYLAGGVTRASGPPGRETYFRASMSAGNLHPVEIYVIAGPQVEGIPAGVHHFSPLSFGLTGLRSGDLRGWIGTSAPVALVLTGIAWRTTWKYGERGWRHLYWDAGTILANLAAAAHAHGLAVEVLSGFDDHRVSRLVDVDGVDEVALAVVPIGEGAEEPPEVASLERVGHRVAPVAPRPIHLPLLVEAQQEGVLRQEEVSGWRRLAGGATDPAPASVEPPGGTRPDTIEEVILRRGSTRVMRRASVPEEALVWAMAAATRRTGLDAAPEGTLLEHYLNIHDVAGVKAGSYRWSGGGLELLDHFAPLREVTARLCLDQPLGGDSAYTVFHCAQLDRILDALGSRGYRAAQLEAGVVSGRLALCAFALGLGATGLTFFDDPVADFFKTAAQPMLVTSVGVAATPPAPAGTPGRPTLLKRRHR